MNWFVIACLQKYINIKLFGHLKLGLILILTFAKLALPRNPYRKSYTPLPFRNYDRGLNFMGGSTHV